MVLVETDLEGFVVADAVDVGGEVVEDLKRQISERLLGLFDPLAGVAFCKANAQVLAYCLHLRMLALLGNVGFCGSGESVEVSDAFLEVVIVDAGLESELVLDGTCESDYHIERRSVVCC